MFAVEAWKDLIDEGAKCCVLGKKFLAEVERVFEKRRGIMEG